MWAAPLLNRVVEKGRTLREGESWMAVSLGKSLERAGKACETRETKF